MIASFLFIFSKISILGNNSGDIQNLISSYAIPRFKIPPPKFLLAKSTYIDSI